MTPPNIDLAEREIFLPVKGYEGIYDVSNMGKVKTLRKDGGYRNREKRFSGDKDGYLKVSLARDGIEKHFRVHRLVATAFIPNPNDLPQINHLNSKKTDNRPENLEWCDDRHNRNHFYGTKNVTSKYPGVSWYKRCKRWRAQIRHNGKKIWLGTFVNEIDAAEAYNQAVLKYSGKEPSL